MLLRTLLVLSNYLLQYTLLKILQLPRNYPLTPFTPVQPNLPSKSSDLRG